LAFRETEIHYSIWLYPEKKDNLQYIVFISVLIHVLFGYFLYYFKPNENQFKEITSSTAPSKPPIHIRFTDGQISNSSPNHEHSNKKLGLKNILKNHSGGVLTDNNPNSKSKTLVPESLLSPDREAKKNPFISKRIPTKNNKDEPVSLPKNIQKNPTNGLDSFLPNSSSAYIDELRKSTQKQQKIEGDSGDIPVVGDDLTPRNGPKIRERYSVKDLGLYQFSQEFKEKFSGIWNSRERWVPPSSPLRPGDIVYYKLYIKGDGSLQKFENLSHKRVPQKDFSAVDKMIEEVVSQVFPMTVPPRFAQNMVTEIVAIQVVGTNSPVQYSFQ